MRSYPIKASAALFAALLICFCAFSQTNFTNGGGDQLWFNPANWDNGLPTSGNDATIPPGFSPVINLTANYDFNFNVSNSGNLTLNPSAFSASSNETFTNSGSFSTNSLFVNHGIFDNTNTGSITNFSTIRNISLASFTNSGNIINGGILNNGTGGIFVNNGFIQINGGNDLVNSGNFTNNTGIDNYGKIDNQSPDFLNNGLITNYNAVENAGVILISVTGNINSGGTFLNKTGATIKNEGTFTSTNTLDNEGEIENIGQFTTSNAFNNSGGSFENSGNYLNNGGTLNNDSDITNNSDFTNSGVLNNSNNALLTNANCATYFNQPGSATTNSGTGAFVNNGIVYQLGASVLQVTSNNGQILTNLADDPSPIANCVIQRTVTLGAGNTATITPGSIDNGSEAPYCAGVTLSLTPVTFDCSNVGNNIVTLTATDVYNNASSCTATVIVTESIVPDITCPANISVQAAPYACSASVVYSVTATDNCGAPAISQTDATGLSSGDDFPFGTTTLSFKAEDASGNTDVCAFTVTVNEYVPLSQALSCDNLVQISLPGNCVSVISPQTLLEGNYGCSDDFSVNINNTGSNIITSGQIGLTLPVKVTNTETGLSCWGNILIEDKLPPVISCTNVQISCSAPEGAYPAPVITDCSAFSVSYTDVVIDFPCNLPLTAVKYRTYVATDASGNSSQCTQTIQYTSGSIQDVIPPADITISCDVTWVADNNGHPAPSNTQNAATGLPGSPTLEGFSVYPAQGSCKFDAAYTDQVYPICDGSYKIVRNWILVDWCNGDIRQFSQFIKILDSTAPVITCPSDTVISTKVNACVANFLVPAATATDNCASSILISRSASQGTFAANNTLLTGLPLGYTTITYTATDGCGNSASCVVSVLVEDQITPTPVCDEITQVAIENNGLATVFAETFDDGSTDNCGIDHFEVRRMESPCNTAGTAFGPQVDFNCCDVNDTIGIVLRVWDVNGNYNDCMIQAYIEDKINPVITCPANQEIFCDDGFNIWDLEQFGQPEFYDNCDVDTTYIREWDLGQCHTGFLYRHWIVTDGGGLTDECAQKITILHHSDFVVDFPEDVTFTDCTLGEIPVPVISDDDCELVAMQYDDLPYDIVPDACYKIVRTWIVVNWCTYDANNPDLTPGGIVVNENNHIFQDDGDGYMRYQQIIKILDEVPPVITGSCEDLTFEDYSNEDDVTGDGDPTTSCDGLVSLQMTAVDSCSGLAALEYRFKIYLNSDLNTTPIYGNNSSVQLEFPYGTHLIKWEVEDGCGNISYCEYHFTVIDKKKPSVVCHQGLSANLVAMDTDADGEPDTYMTTVWDTEVLQSWDDNCTPTDQLQLRVTKNTGTGVHPDGHSVTFDCSEQGLQNVELWVGDNAGNWDYCSTFIDIQDNSHLCGPQQAMATIAGGLMTEENETVSDATIQIAGVVNNTMYQMQTVIDGLFNMSVPSNEDYQITAQRDGDYGNGVSTYDIVLITKHILGIQQLGSPYKMIAADVNNSAAITAMDLVEIRRLILGVTNEFTNNSSWRFIDRDYVFPNPANPWEQDFPELINVDNLANGDEMSADFIAAKIGDVNNSAIANATLLGEERHTDGTIAFNTINKKVSAGETFEVPFKVNKSDFSGYQFTLSFGKEQVELMNIITNNEKMSDDNFGVFDDGITTSWNGHLEGDGQLMFTLVFKAKQNLEIKDIFKLGSARTMAEGYNKSGDLMDISLAFDDGSISESNSFELYQNEPNPFDNATVIRFSLPESAPAKLRIVDAAGRELWATEKIFSKGLNAVQVNQEIFPCQGVYFYILENEQFTATKKMIFNR